MLKILAMRPVLLMFALCFWVVTPAARAQVSGQIGSGPVITAGAKSNGASGNEVGFCLSSTACQWGAVGSSSESVTVDGYTFQAFADLPGPAKGGATYLRTVVSFSGFSSDPGQSWLVAAKVNGLTFTGPTAKSYTYSNGQAWWYWQTGPAFQGRTGPVNCTIAHAGSSGWLRPKYEVVGLTYAPPGKQSSAVYSNGFMSGTSTSTTSTFNVGVTEKLSITTGVDLFGVLSGETTESYSAGWSQQQDNTSSVTVSQSESTGLNVPGPASSGAGVDHDYDTVYVWLNPEVFVEVFPSSVNIADLGWDARDTVSGMDVVPITVGQLRGTQSIPAALQTRLNRTWDPSLGALTSADFQLLLHADPFATNPSFNPNTDTTGRYEFPRSGNPPTPTDLIFNYIPVPPGGQPTAQTYMSSYTSTSSTGQTATDTYTVGYSIDAGVSVDFIAKVQGKLSSSVTFTWTNKWSNTVTGGTTQSANFTIVPPLASDNYTGPTAIQVWKDNVYGTFMFYPEN